MVVVVTGLPCFKQGFQVACKLLRENAAMDEYLVEVADGFLVAGKTLILKKA